MKLPNSEKAGPPQIRVEDPRLTGILLWVVTLLTALSTPVLLTILGQGIAIRDNQIKMMERFESVKTEVDANTKKLENLEERLNNNHLRIQEAFHRLRQLERQ